MNTHLEVTAAGLKLTYDSTTKSYYFVDNDLAATHTPIGPDYTKRWAFMARHNLRETRSKLDWRNLVPAAYSVELRRYRTLPPVDGRFVMMQRPLVDHYEFFNALQRGRLWVTQPYGLSLTAYTDLCQTWTEMGRFVAISYAAAWWYPGRTPLIAISDFPFTFEDDA